MKKKDFFGGMFLGAGVCFVLFALLGGFISNKIALTNSSLDVITTTSDIVLILKDLEAKNVENEYAAILLDRRLNDLEYAKEWTNSAEKKGKKHNKYSQYNSSIQGMVEAGQNLKGIIANGIEIDLEKDMNEFLDASKEYQEQLELQFKRIW